MSFKLIFEKEVNETSRRKNKTLQAGSMGGMVYYGGFKAMVKREKLQSQKEVRQDVA